MKEGVKLAFYLHTLFPWEPCFLDIGGDTFDIRKGIYFSFSQTRHRQLVQRATRC